MKIWVIGRGAPSKYSKISGSFELDQARMLSKRGHDVCYLTAVFHPYKKIGKWGYNSWSESGVTIESVSAPFFPARMRIHFRPYKRYVWKRFLSRVCEKHGVPDVIHVHYPTLITDYREVLRFQLTGTKVVATEHWSHVLTKQLHRCDVEQLSAYVENSDAFLCVSAPLARSVLEITKNSKAIDIVPNMVPEVFVPRERPAGAPYTFVVAQRLVPTKQTDGIIRAFSEAFSNIDNVRLRIVGNGEESTKLKQLCGQSGIADRVLFDGELDRIEVAEAIGTADALVSFSSLETFGVQIVEAWSCGIPVIMTNETPCVDYLSDGLGLAVDSSSEGELAKAMTELYQERERYDKKRIASFAEQKFSEDAIYSQIMSAYFSKTT